MEWYDRDPQRLLLERALLEKNHPEARMVLSRGRVHIFLPVVRGGNRYVVDIRYPSDFPDGEPEAFPVQPEISTAPHQFSNDRLCLHGRGEVGPQTTGKVICDWVKDWIGCYEQWLASGRRQWPRANRDAG